MGRRRGAGRVGREADMLANGRNLERIDLGDIHPKDLKTPGVERMRATARRFLSERCCEPGGTRLRVKLIKGRRTKLGIFTVSLRADGMAPSFKVGDEVHANTAHRIKPGDEALVLTKDSRLYLRRAFPTRTGLTLRAHDTTIKAERIPTRAVMFAARVTCKVCARRR